MGKVYSKAALADWSGARDRLGALVVDLGAVEAEEGYKQTDFNDNFHASSGLKDLLQRSVS